MSYMSQEVTNEKQPQQKQPQQEQPQLSSMSLSLFDLIDRILDKGLVINAYVSISVIGIKDLIVVRARIAVASIETYLKYTMGLHGEPVTTHQQLGDESEKQPQEQNQPMQQPQQQQQLQQLQQLLQQLQQ